MIQIVELHNMPPEKKRELYKQACREAREHLSMAQFIVGPSDQRYTKMNDMIAILEEEIMKRA